MSSLRRHPLTMCQRGFTLVEAIVVMVITGVLAGIMVLFIRKPVQSYADAAARADMSDVADLALRRMARELHTALPNSVRATTIAGVVLLEFIPTKAGGQYLDVSDNGNGTPLSFTDSSVLSFTVVGPMPAAPYAIVPITPATPNGDSIVVANFGSGYANADAYAFPAKNRAGIGNVSVDANGFVSSITMTSNPFAVGAGVVPNSSPDHRFQVVSQPVTFRCVPDAGGKGTLTRHANYGFNPAQADPLVAGSLLAKGVLACDFSVTQAANRNSGLIGMSIALARSSPGAAANNLETVTLVNEVHVNNTP